jgi:hypothetical protein
LQNQTTKVEDTQAQGKKIGECVYGPLFPIFPMNHIKAAVEDVQGERRAWTHIDELD